MPPQLYLGLMSGTSLDGIDAACIDCSLSPPKLIATHYEKISAPLRVDILAVCEPAADEINRLGQLDVQLGRLFAAACNTLIKENNLSAQQIIAIGSHGQTIRHQPHLADYPFTLQIGDPNTIAALTGITTVADFRRRDMALAGQGAPLVPAFHQELFRDAKQERVILNIGGIANITLLSADRKQPVSGFDTGPGNALLNCWTQLHLQKNHDEDGAWAAGGTINSALLDQLLSDTYFSLKPPKSTGRELFNKTWLQQKIPPARWRSPTPFTKGGDLSPQDIQTTLTELTALSIANAILQHAPKTTEILVCGGGVHNTYLMQRLQNALPVMNVFSTQHYGVDPDWIEAMAFAWFAKLTLEKKPGSLPSVTGAKRPAILGGIYYP